VERDEAVEFIKENEGRCEGGIRRKEMEQQEQNQEWEGNEW